MSTNPSPYQGTNAPTGAASGVLSGSYPGPGFASTIATVNLTAGTVGTLTSTALTATDATITYAPITSAQITSATIPTLNTTSFTDTNATITNANITSMVAAGTVSPLNAATASLTAATVGTLTLTNPLAITSGGLGGTSPAIGNYGYYTSPIPIAQGMTFPREFITATPGSQGSSIIMLKALGLQSGQNITSMTLMTGSTAKVGTTNAVHAWMALTDNSRVVKAVTADQTDANVVFGTASTFTTLNFAAPFTTTYSGLYYAAWAVTASTTPTFNGAAGVTTNVAGAASATAIMQGTSATTSGTPPTVGQTLGAITSVAAANWWVELT